MNSECMPSMNSELAKTAVRPLKSRHGMPVSSLRNELINVCISYSLIQSFPCFRANSSSFWRHWTSGNKRRVNRDLGCTCSYAFMLDLLISSQLWISNVFLDSIAACETSVFFWEKVRLCCGIQAAWGLWVEMVNRGGSWDQALCVQREHDPRHWDTDQSQHLQQQRRRTHKSYISGLLTKNRWELYICRNFIYV